MGLPPLPLPLWLCFVIWLFALIAMRTAKFAKDKGYEGSALVRLTQRLQSGLMLFFYAGLLLPTYVYWRELDLRDGSFLFLASMFVGPVLMIGLSVVLMKLFDLVLTKIIPATVDLDQDDGDAALLNGQPLE